MEPKKYILPIEATTLAHYYSRAYIAPISCLKEGHHDAIQSIYPNALLLTEHYGVKGSNCNCYIVVRMAEDELKSERVHRISDDFLLYCGALPISRVDEIVFNSKEQKDTTITNIEMGNAFVRGCRISVESNFEQVDIPKCDVSGEDTTQQITDLKAKLKEYDRIMGALMFMRLAKEQSTTYSDNFLQAIALFSPYMAKQLKSLGIDDTTKYKHFFEKKFEQYRAILQDFIKEDTVRNFARTKKINITVDPITGYDFKTLSNTDGATYILALLQNFSLTDGDGGRDKVDDLILNGFYHRGFITKGKAENFAFYYGYNRGYDKFRNQYKLDKKCVRVKFDFDSLFEKFIAEEVFSYTVNPQKQPDFSVLGADGQSFESKKIDTDTYSILGSTLVVKKKWEPIPEVTQQKNKASETKSAVGSEVGSENKNLVDIRNAVFIAQTLTKDKDRKKVAEWAGIPTAKSHKKEEIVVFLLQQPIERLQELYAKLKEEEKKSKAAKEDKKKGVVEAKNNEPQEQNLFTEQHA